MSGSELEVQNLGNTLQSDNEFVEPRTTGGKFIQIRLEVENRSGEAKTFSDVNIIDAQGRTFEDLTDALEFIDNNETCLLEQLNPNVPKICTKIFELPPDATGLKLKVGDLDILGQSEATIDLGLD